MLSAFIAPVVSIIATSSTSIAVEGLVKQLTPVDLKAVPAFGIKVGAAVVGGLIAAKIGAIVLENVNSVVETVTNTEESEIVDPEIIQED